jgi:hypothetical protein
MGGRWLAFRLRERGFISHVNHGVIVDGGRMISRLLGQQVIKNFAEGLKALVVCA